MNALESLYLTHDVSNEKILEFLQTHHDTHNIIMLETPQRAVQQRLLMRPPSLHERFSHRCHASVHSNGDSACTHSWYPFYPSG